MRPNRSTVWATAAFTASETVTSQGKASTASPNSSARLASSSDGRARQATRIRAPTSAATELRLNPFGPPVTTQNMPENHSKPERHRAGQGGGHTWKYRVDPGPK